MSIKEKMNSKNFLLSLVLSDDRHDLSNFLYDVDDAKRNEMIDSDDFILFRNGFVVNSIVELKKNPKMAGRELQPSEILDKINYLSLIPDVESLNTSYTNSDIIDGLCCKDRDFSWWFGCGTMTSLPVETRNKIAIKLLDKGNVEMAKDVLVSISKSLEYERENSRPFGFSR